MKNKHIPKLKRVVRDRRGPVTGVVHAQNNLFKESPALQRVKGSLIAYLLLLTLSVAP